MVQPPMKKIVKQILVLALKGLPVVALPPQLQAQM